MNSKKYRYLAYAVAVATSFAAVPGLSYADEAGTQQGTAAAASSTPVTDAIAAAQAAGQDPAALEKAKAEKAAAAKAEAEAKAKAAGQTGTDKASADKSATKAQPAAKSDSATPVTDAIAAQQAAGQTPGDTTSSAPEAKAPATTSPSTATTPAQPATPEIKVDPNSKSSTPVTDAVAAQQATIHESEVVPGETPLTTKVIPDEPKPEETQATPATETTEQSSTTQPTVANQPAASQPAASQPMVSAAAQEAAIKAAQNQTTTTATAERTQNWAKTRPQEDAITDSLKQFEGKTIVDTVFEGASDDIKTIAKSVLTMRTGDMFTSKGLSRDRDAIYNTGYFYDLYPSFQLVPEGVVITYHMLENPILQSVTIKGNTVETNETLYNLMTVRKGYLLNSRTLQEDVQSIQGQYRKDGYILAKVSDLNIDKEGHLTITVNEGVLEGYKIKGNTKTKDYVILREMRQKVGEPFNSKKARRSMQRVYNLGFFEDVNIKMNPGVNPNAVVMELDVKEKRTGSFGIGAGYSSEDGVLGSISLGDTNFRGTGDAISITYETSGDDEDAHGYTFSYRHPWIDKKETVGTFRLYNRTYEYDDYDTDGNLKDTYMRKYSGGEFQFGRPVSEYSTNYLTFRNRKDSYVRPEYDGYLWDRSGDDYADWRHKNFGTTRSITYEHVTDTRDNVYNPTTGTRISLGAEFAGWLGGDFNFQKYTISDNRYFKVGHAQVVALRGQYGFGNGDISEFNQYEIGGQNTLRGYREDQFRGDKMILGTVEYRFPIVSKVQGALFTDWGGAWNGGATPENIKGSIGVGLSLNTPLGPLRIDYGRGSDGGRVHFTVGTGF